MNDLATFYAARLDEVEAAAKAALSQSAGEGVRWWFDDATPETPREFHVARHDPARVLREVGAGRAILAEYAPISGEPEYFGWADPLRLVVRILAAVYADHPDYRQEWKP